MASIRWQFTILLICTTWISAEAGLAMDVRLLVPDGDVPFDDVDATTEPPVITPIDCSNGSVDVRCQQCCVVEGPEGPQGQPGRPGLAGIAGMKGDQGLPGVCERQCVDGERGPRGYRGPKGDQGVPGNQGPAGLRGPCGAKGDRGMRGESGRDGLNGLKGEKGDPGERSTTQSTSAFYVGRHSNLIVTSGSETITFDTTFTNTGNDFNTHTGIFTCRVPGLYHFAYNFRAYKHSRYGLNIDLYVNDVKKSEIYLQGISKHIMQSQTAVLNLQVNDRVWLKAHSATYIFGSPTHNTFSVYLIQASTDSVGFPIGPTPKSQSQRVSTSLWDIDDDVHFSPLGPHTSRLGPRSLPVG